MVCYPSHIKFNNWFDNTATWSIYSLQILSPSQFESATRWSRTHNLKRCLFEYRYKYIVLFDELHLKWKVAMQRVQRLEILVTCRSLLKLLNLCNRNGVYIHDVKIPNIILFCAFLSSIIYEITMIIWFVVETDMELQRKSNVLCIFVANLQVILTYISMIKSNDFTMDTIEHMQKIVDKRECWRNGCYINEERKRKKTNEQTWNSLNHCFHFKLFRQDFEVGTKVTSKQESKQIVIFFCFIWKFEWKDHAWNLFIISLKKKNKEK